MKTIDITPSPEGIRHNIQLFEEQIAKSEHLIKVGSGRSSPTRSAAST